ncbi:hypothetical protein ACFLVP_00770, partial [Chloroflexota bacterium]
MHRLRRLFRMMVVCALVLTTVPVLVLPVQTAYAGTVSKFVDRQLTAATQSTQSWNTAASITLTEDGSWLVFTSFEFGVDDATTNGEVRLYQDSTTELQYGRYEDMDSTTTYKSWFWMTRVERSGSDVVLDLDFEPMGSVTARMRNAIIAAVHLDDIGTEDTDWRWNQDNTTHSELGTDFTAANNIIVTETWTPSEAEDWIIIANMELTANATGYNGDGRLSQNDEANTYDLTSEEAENTAEWRWWSSLRTLTLSASTQKFEIQARSDGKTNADARRGRFFAVRKAVFNQASEFRADSYTAVGTINTWEEKVNASFTPSSTQDVLILGHAGIDFGALGDIGRTRVHEEETDDLMYNDCTTPDTTDLAPVAYADILNWDTSTHDADLDINASNTGVTFGDAAVIFIGLSSPDATVSTTGTQTTNMNIPSTDQYVGGAFVITETTSSRFVTGITITETGTVDALNDLDDIKLYYELDTSAPYDGASENYAGTETQFGSTDTT